MRGAPRTRPPHRGLEMRSVSVLAALTLTAPLAAQQRDSVAADSVRRDTAHVRQLAPQAITGTRLTEAGDERTPVQVDRLDLRNAVPGPGAAAEVVARLPGVSVFDDQGTRAQPTLNVRGFTLSPVVGVPQGVSVFLDGVRINEGDAQQVYFDLIPMEAVDRAELIRGPTPLFGKNTLAGALVLTTARGEATPHLDAEVEGGSFGYRAGDLTASGTAKGFDGYLLARGSEEDGYRTLTPVRSRMVFTNVGRRGPSGDIALTAMMAKDRIYQAGSLPESWLRERRDTNYTSGDFFRPDLLHLALRGSRTVGRGVLRGNVYHRRNEYEQFNVNVDAADTRALVDDRSFGGTAEADVVVYAGSRPLGLTGGVEYVRNNVRYRVFNQPTASAPLLDPDCDPASGLCESARVAEDNAAVFAQGILELTPHFSVTGSARADYVRVPFRDLRAPENDGTSTFQRLSPRLGVNYRLGESLRGYTVVANGFRAPAALELACADELAPCPLPFSLGDDPPLRAVGVWNYESGLDFEPSEAFALDIVGFRSEVRNEIVFAASNRTAGFFQNIPRTRRQGVEMSAQMTVARGIRGFASYTFLDATYQSTVQLASAVENAEPAEPGDRFPLSPAHRGTVGLGLTRLARALVIDGELSANVVSSQFLRGDDANDQTPLRGYAVANLRMEIEHARFALSAHITNLFDRRFETFGIFASNPQGPIGGPRPAPGSEPVERFLNPGYPRAGTVSVKVKL
jgi:iron complex outermembrane recepter protein